jgi:hypothetical protein
VITAEDTLLTDDSEDNTKTWPAIALAAFAIVVGIFCVKYGLQTLTWIEGKSLASSNPWVLTVPQPMAQAVGPVSAPVASAPLSKAAASAAAKVAAAAKNDLIKLYQFEFTPPWPGKYKIEPTLTQTTLRFDSGQALVFYDPDTQKDTVGSLKTSDPLSFQKFAAVFAGAPIESNYDMYKRVYEAAPGLVSPLMDAGESQREHTLMLWKVAFGPDLWTDTFRSFDWGTVKGFQFGEPAGGKPVAVRAYDDRNRQFRFIFAVIGGPGSVPGAQITQEQIDTAVKTLKPVPFNDR